MQGGIQGGGFEPSPARNICPTRENVTKMNINKFLTRFLGFFIYPPPPRKNLLLTWYSYDGKAAKLIDYLIVNRRLTGSIQNNRVYRSAITDFKSKDDHEY